MCGEQRYVGGLSVCGSWVRGWRRGGEYREFRSGDPVVIEVEIGFLIGLRSEVYEVYVRF